MNGVFISLPVWIVSSIIMANAQTCDNSEIFSPKTEMYDTPGKIEKGFGFA